jgi:hypothetical protein
MQLKKFKYLRTNDFDDLVVCENLVYNTKKTISFRKSSIFTILKFESISSSLSVIYTFCFVCSNAVEIPSDT